MPTSYTAAQLGNAKTIISVGQSMGMSPADIKTALMVALDESSLQNDANPDVPASMGIAHDSTGTDHDSVGLFQQRSSQGWGTVAAEMDPAQAAAMFYTALKAVPGRDTMSPAEAAQAVQHSGDPTGSNYAAQQGNAETLYTQLAGTGSTSGTASSTTGSGLSAWWTDHGGWKRLGVYAIGAALLWIGAAYLLGTSRAMKDAVKAVGKIA